MFFHNSKIANNLVIFSRNYLFRNVVNSMCVHLGHF